MKKHVWNKSTGRDYRRDYELQGTPAQIRRRSQRNKARRLMLKKGKVRKGDGKDVHHRHRGLSNKSSNLAILSRSKNRAMK